jgi:hypothetical protein
MGVKRITGGFERDLATGQHQDGEKHQSRRNRLCHVCCPFGHFAYLVIQPLVSTRSSTFVLLLNRVAPGKGVSDAVEQIVLSYLSVHLMHGRPDCIDLRQDLNAAAVRVDHPEQAANLPVDTLTPCGYGLADCLYVCGGTP